MSAPTEAEIREAVSQEWNRWRHDGVDGPTLSGRLVDLAMFDLFCGVGRVLYDRSREDGMRGPLDEIEHEIMAPIVAECERRLLDGMAAAFEEFARQHPKARRARRRAVAAERRTAA
jgi:hypothetical protein